MISKEREQELYELWLAESDDIDTQSWFYYLNREEQELVVKWDSNYENGMLNWCNAMKEAIENNKIKGIIN